MGGDLDSMISNSRPHPLFRYAGFVLSVSGARVAGILITSVTFPFLVRRLGVETYGIWSYVVALCAFLDVMANPGLTIHTAQQVAARRHAAAELIPDVLVLRGFGSLAAIAILLLVTRFEVRVEVHWLLRWYGVGTLCVGLTGSDFLLTSLELFHVRSLLSFIQQALYAAGVLILVRSPRDVIWVAGSILGSALLTNLAGWLVLWRNGFRPRLVISPQRWRAILVPSLHYAATTVMATIYHRTGHIVVRWLLGEHALGLYSAAARFVDILRNFVSIVLSVLMPRMAFSAQSQSGMKRMAHAAVSALAVISIPLMLGTLATAHLVVPWAIGASFVEAVRPVRWMAGYLLAAPIASLLSGTILYTLGRHRAYLASATVGAVAAILLFLMLVPALGLAGASAAFVLAELAVGVSAYLFLPPDLRDLWKNPVIAVAGISALFMVAAVKLANSYSSQPLLVVAVGAAVYMMVSALMGKRSLVQQFGGAS
jgi:O-antigen/teichoic acid export membrane protein